MINYIFTRNLSQLEMFRSILIILRELLNINKAYIKHSWFIKYIKICIQNVCRHFKIRFYRFGHQKKKVNILLIWTIVKIYGRLRLKCDGTRAETRFRLSAKRRSPFKSAGASVHSTTGSRGVRISGSNAGYIMFRGSVKGTGYPHHSPVSPSLPLPCVTVCQHISTGLTTTSASMDQLYTSTNEFYKIWRHFMHKFSWCE
jgi:hypothetical protein